MDSYTQTLARAVRDLESLTHDKLIELTYSPAGRKLGHPAILKDFLETTDSLRRAHHTYATQHQAEG